MMYQIKTKIKRFLNRLFKAHRPGSYPFLSGDGFRSIANFVYDQFLDFKPEEVNYGDIVFVRNNHLKEYFLYIHPEIKKSYVLISHNEDSSIPQELANNIDDKILHWYAENLEFRHPKMTVLPIGLQNFSVGYPENFIQSFYAIAPKIPEKINRVAFGFSTGTYKDNKERNDLNDLLIKHPLADKISKPRTEYYDELSKYKFVVSPRGGGIDCHRTWEALYLKVIPILIRDDFSEQLLELGLPILIVDKWSDLSNLNTDDLHKFYEKCKDSFSNPSLYLDYWYNLFKKYRKAC